MIEQRIVDVLWDANRDGHYVIDEKRRDKVQHEIVRWNDQGFEVQVLARPVYQVLGTQLLVTKRAT